MERGSSNSPTRTRRCTRSARNRARSRGRDASSWRLGTLGEEAARGQGHGTRSPDLAAIAARLDMILDRLAKLEVRGTQLLSLPGGAGWGCLSGLVTAPPSPPLSHSPGWRRQEEAPRGGHSQAPDAGPKLIEPHLPGPARPSPPCMPGRGGRHPSCSLSRHRLPLRHPPDFSAWGSSRVVGVVGELAEVWLHRLPGSLPQSSSLL